LRKHVEISHFGKREWICDYEGCGLAFGYKFGLQRHKRSIHSEKIDVDDNEPLEERPLKKKRKNEDDPRLKLLGFTVTRPAIGLVDKLDI
jgi:hypothetical protein